MKFIIQHRKDNNDRGLIESSKHVPSEKDWISKEGQYETLREAVDEAVSLIERNIYNAKNLRIISVVAEFQSKVTVEELPPS